MTDVCDQHRCVTLKMSGASFGRLRYDGWLLSSFARKQPLLWDCRHILYRVVEIQSGREVQKEYRQHHRHHVAHHLRLWVWRRIPHPDPGHRKHRYPHQERWEEVRVTQRNVTEPKEGPAPKLNGVLEPLIER